MTWVQFRGRAKAHLSWLFVRPRLFWFGGLPLALGILACSMGRTEQSVRIAGLALELLGLGIALWGLEKTRKDFGRPSVVALLKKWWAARPKGGVRVVSTSFAAEKELALQFALSNGTR